ADRSAELGRPALVPAFERSRRANRVPSPGREDRLGWLVTPPIALAGIEGAHAVGNSLFGPPVGVAELFESPGSAPLVPLAGAVVAVCVVLGLARRLTGASHA